MKFGKEDVIRFPDVFLFLHVQKPTGPTRGTAFDHIGFAVPDVPAMTTRIVANGYELTTGREPAPGAEGGAAHRGQLRQVLVHPRPRRRQGGAGHQHGGRTRRRSRTTTCTSSTSSTSRCSSGT